MSLDLINHKLTTSTTNKNGVITWSNPAVDVKINSKGQVFKHGEIYKGSTVSSRNGVCYYKINYQYKPRKQSTIPFSSLFSRIVLGEKLKARTLVLKDKSKGYVVGNTETIPCNQSLTYRGAKTPKQPKLNEVAIEMKETTQTKEKTMEQYFTVYEAKNEHITEDGAIFPTKELAEWHQTNVSKGKGNAQVVLDYNGGFVLAEQIYLQEVVYNKAKPYTNFIDVLNNNQGIVSVVQEEHCKFDKLDNEHGLSPVQLNLFGLGKVINLPYTKVQAEKINTSLNKYSEAFSKLEDEHKTLKDLLKQVS